MKLKWTDIKITEIHAKEREETVEHSGLAARDLIAQRAPESLSQEVIQRQVKPFVWVKRGRDWVGGADALDVIENLCRSWSVDDTVFAVSLVPSSGGWPEKGVKTIGVRRIEDNQLRARRDKAQRLRLGAEHKAANVVDLSANPEALLRVWVPSRFAGHKYVRTWLSFEVSAPGKEGIPPVEIAYLGHEGKVEPKKVITNEKGKIRVLLDEGAHGFHEIEAKGEGLINVCVILKEKGFAGDAAGQPEVPWNFYFFSFSSYSHKPVAFPRPEPRNKPETDEDFNPFKKLDRIFAAENRAPSDEGTKDEGPVDEAKKYPSFSWEKDPRNKHHFPHERLAFEWLKATMPDGATYEFEILQDEFAHQASGRKHFPEKEGKGAKITFESASPASSPYDKREYLITLAIGAERLPPLAVGSVVTSTLWLDKMKGNRVECEIIEVKTEKGVARFAAAVADLAQLARGKSLTMRTEKHEELTVKAADYVRSEPAIRTSKVAQPRKKSDERWTITFQKASGAPKVISLERAEISTVFHKEDANRISAVGGGISVRSEILYRVEARKQDRPAQILDLTMAGFNDTFESGETAVTLKRDFDVPGGLTKGTSMELLGSQPTDEELITVDDGGERHVFRATVAALRSVKSGAPCSLSRQGATLTVAANEHVNEPAEIRGQKTGNVSDRWVVTFKATDGSIEDMAIDRPEIQTLFHGKTRAPIQGERLRLEAHVSYTLTSVPTTVDPDKDDGSRSWEGHCNVIAPASILFQEPEPFPHADEEGAFTLHRDELKLLIGEMLGGYGESGKAKWNLGDDMSGRKDPTQMLKPNFFTRLRDVKTQVKRWTDDRRLGQKLDEIPNFDQTTELRLVYDFAQRGASFLTTLQEWIGKQGEMLLSDLRSIHKPAEVWNQAVYFYTATYSEYDFTTFKKLWPVGTTIKPEVVPTSNPSRDTTDHLPEVDEKAPKPTPLERLASYQERLAGAPGEDAVRDIVVHLRIQANGDFYDLEPPGIMQKPWKRLPAEVGIEPDTGDVRLKDHESGWWREMNFRFRFGTDGQIDLDDLDNRFFDCSGFDGDAGRPVKMFPPRYLSVIVPPGKEAKRGIGNPYCTPLRLERLKIKLRSRYR
ncbi:Hypothetical protein A7982_05596 [Minicystis rosea]|nr:Hypothetical protein A7982_05596 [Minicystis rosea]